MTAPSRFKIYGDVASGNCQKVRLVADHLGLLYEWVPLDITKGGSRTATFLAKFPQGQVPAIEFSDGRCLAQSNGILRFIARALACCPMMAGPKRKLTSGFSGSSTATSPTSPFAARTCFIRESLRKRAKHGASSGARKPSTTWRTSLPDSIGWQGAISRSRISRSSPTRMSRTRGASTFLQGPIYKAGLPGANVPSLRQSLIEVDIDELGRRNHYQRLSLWGRLRRWICIGGFALDVWRQRRALASLGDRELKDVGQSRSTAYREANRSILLSLPRLPLVADIVAKVFLHW
jgi:uncharacterized protein YjiS (DUF1127 family)